MKFGADDKSEQCGELVTPMGIAREIAARVWCDQEMRSTAMDIDAAEEIATIIERVKRIQEMIHRPQGTTPLHGKPLNEDGAIVFSQRRTDGKPKYQDNHGKHRARDLTPEEAQAAYDAAPAVPLSDERIQEIVVAATASPGPQTHEEAR